MSTHPRIESRVSAQERRQLILDARIEELSEDMTASFKQLSEYLGKIEDRFDKIEATMATKEDLATMATKEDLAAMATKEDLATMATKEDLATMATKEDLATMATKEDLATMATKKELAAMENRILDSFKQLLAAINPQFPPSQ